MDGEDLSGKRQECDTMFRMVEEGEGHGLFLLRVYYKFIKARSRMQREGPEGAGVGHVFEYKPRFRSKAP